MQTREVIARARAHLITGGIENAALESEWIVAHYLGVDRSQLDPRQPLPADVQAEIRAAVGRRNRHEPLQYILGEVEFLGCRIEVSQAVLIPRPETEWLVEAVLNGCKQDILSVLDIGTGSGAIAIAIAAHRSEASVVALDVAPQAIETARRNSAINDLEHRVRCVRADLRWLPFADASFDLIVSNPPYIRSGDIADLPKDVRNHEPVTALDGGPDGCEFYSSIAEQCTRLLKPGGRIGIELPGHPPESIRDLYLAPCLSDLEVLADLSGKPRLLRAQNST